VVLQKKTAYILGKGEIGMPELVTEEKKKKEKKKKKKRNRLRWRARDRN